MTLLPVGVMACSEVSFWCWVQPIWVPWGVVP